MHLPSSWIFSKLDELNEFRSFNINPASFPLEIFDLYSVPIFSTRKPEKAIGGEIGSAKQIVEPSDVLISKINPRINRVWQVGPTEGIRQIASSEWIGFRNKNLEERYFLHYFCSPSFRERLCADVTGVGGSLTRAQPKRVAEFLLPVAPLSEQRRIADKLDTILTRVDTLNERLARITPLLKRFRQSILAAATSGRLTEDWRISGIAPETTDNILWSIPSNWQWTPAENICAFITKGTTPSKSAMTANQGEIPYIKVYNLTFDGALDFTIEPTFIPRAVHETDLKRSRCLPGDVLMNIVGPPLGKVSVVPHGYSEWNINQAIARFRPAGVQSAYLSICLRNPSLISHAVSRAKATAGQFNLTLEICRGLPIPVPPVEEQTEIVRRVEILFAYADRLEARLQTARTAAERLTPALLAKAFRGELVPQDPNDEPATELLRRLREARAAAPTPSRRGRKSAG